MYLSPIQYPAFSHAGTPSHRPSYLLSKCIRPARAALVASILALAMASPSDVRADDLEAVRPSLGDLMTVTQLRHFKLWFAQRVENWELANYELVQFKKTIDRIVSLYPEIGSFAQAKLIREKTAPEFDALSDSIAKKDRQTFEVAYGRITNACNECHQAAGVGFITVRVPTSSPFSNQIFEPQQ